MVLAEEGRKEEQDRSLSQPSHDALRPCQDLMLEEQTDLRAAQQVGHLFLPSPPPTSCSI